MMAPSSSLIAGMEQLLKHRPPRPKALSGLQWPSVEKPVVDTFHQPARYQPAFLSLEL